MLKKTKKHLRNILEVRPKLRFMREQNPVRHQEFSPLYCFQALINEGRKKKRLSEWSNQIRAAGHFFWKL